MADAWRGRGCHAALATPPSWTAALRPYRSQRGCPSPLADSAVAPVLALCSLSLCQPRSSLWHHGHGQQVKLAAVYSYHIPAQVKSSITFSFRCSYGTPSLASFVTGEHHRRSRHRSCFCLHGQLASGNNGARQGDQRVRGDLPVLPHHSLATEVAVDGP